MLGNNIYPKQHYPETKISNAEDSTYFNRTFEYREGQLHAIIFI